MPLCISESDRQILENVQNRANRKVKPCLSCNGTGHEMRYVDDADEPVADGDCWDCRGFGITLTDKEKLRIGYIQADLRHLYRKGLIY